MSSARRQRGTKASRLPFLSVLRAIQRQELCALDLTELRMAARFALVPTHAFVDVTMVPPYTLRRFTPCGRFLIAVDPHLTTVIVYRFELGGERLSTVALPENTFSSEPLAQMPARSTAETRPAFNLDRLFENQNTVLDGSNSHVPGGVSWGRNELPFLAGEDVRSLGTAEQGQRANNSTPSRSLDSRISRSVLLQRRSLSGVQYVPNNTTLSESGTDPQPADTDTGLLSLVALPGHSPASSQEQPDSALLRETVSHSCPFSRYFTLLHKVNLASSDILIRDFCLALSEHLVFATIQAPSASAAASSSIPAVSSVPAFQRISLHLFHTETGQVRDRYTLVDDYITPEGHVGVHLRGNMLCLLSIRHQTLHLLRVQESSGRMMPVGKVGAHCDPDDELEIARVREMETRYCASIRRYGRAGSEKPDGASGAGYRDGSSLDARGNAFLRQSTSGGETNHGLSRRTDHAMSSINRHNRADRAIDSRSDGTLRTDIVGNSPGNANTVSGNDSSGDSDSATTQLPPRVTETGLGNGKSSSGFVTGLMHRLLAFVYRQYLSERNERFFFRVIGQYSMLVMLKAQLLDDNHLLIRLGSLERGGKALDPANSTCFYLIYCLSSSSIISLYDNKSTELLMLYEAHRDFFLGDPMVSSMLLRSRNVRLLTRSSHEDFSAVHGHLQNHSVTSSNSRTGAQQQQHRYDVHHGVVSRPPADAARITSRPLGPQQHRRIREALAALPVTAQSNNPSVYLDRRLFSYAEDRSAALDGRRPLSMRECPSEKFVAARRGGLRFKLTPGLPGGDNSANGTRRGQASSAFRRRALFLFHPTLPFVISLQFSLGELPVMNFHLHY